MEEMKLVPKRRFKGFKEYWKISRLEDIVDITMGHSPSSVNYTDNPSDYILVQGNADLKNNRVCPRVWTTQVTKLANKGDLILTVRAPVGEVGKTDYDVVLGRGVAGVKGNEFIFQLLMKINRDGYWNTLSTGSTFDSINSNDIKTIEILTPNDQEQQKIGEFFKVLDERITNQERKIAKIKALKSAYLTEMFPQEGETVPKRRFEGFEGEWQSVKIHEIANRLDNLRIPITASKRIPGMTPYYGANGIQDYVKGHTHDGENVLIAEDGANDLNNYPVHYCVGEIWVNNHAHVLRGKDNILNNLFFSYLLKTINMTPYLVGGGRAKLNSDIMMGIDCIIPEIAEQQKIGQFFKNLDDQITTEEKKLEKLKQMKEAYLEEMFV